MLMNASIHRIFLIKLLGSEQLQITIKIGEKNEKRIKQTENII